MISGRPDSRQILQKYGRSGSKRPHRGNDPDYLNRVLRRTIVGTAHSEAGAKRRRAAPLSSCPGYQETENEASRRVFVSHQLFIRKFRNVTYHGDVLLLRSVGVESSEPRNLIGDHRLITQQWRAWFQSFGKCRYQEKADLNHNSIAIGTNPSKLKIQEYYL